MLNLFVNLVGYRTIIFNALMFIFTYAMKQGWIHAVPDKGMIDAFIDTLYNNVPQIIAGGNIILRFLTTTPVGKKPS